MRREEEQNLFPWETQHPPAPLTSSDCPEPGTLPAEPDWRKMFSRIIKISQISKKTPQFPEPRWLLDCPRRGSDCAGMRRGGGSQGSGGRSQLPFWVKKMKFCCLRALDIPHEVTIPVLPCWTDRVRVDQRQDYPKEFLQRDQGGLDLLQHHPVLGTQGCPCATHTNCCSTSQPSCSLLNKPGNVVLKQDVLQCNLL